MKDHLTNIARTLLVASTALTLAGCGGGEKTTTTTVSPDGTETTKVEETKDSTITTTRTVEPKTTDEQVDDKNQPKDTTINITTGKDGTGQTDQVHIKGPGIKIDSSDNDESVHIKLPFVNIQKDGAGSKVRIKAPFVRINTN